MVVYFKQACEIEGVAYGVGNHEVPDELKSHWYLQALAKDGLVTVHGVKMEDLSDKKFPPKPDAKKMEAAHLAAPAPIGAQVSKPLGEDELKSESKKHK